MPLLFCCFVFCLVFFKNTFLQIVLIFLLLCLYCEKFISLIICLQQRICSVK